MSPGVLSAPRNDSAERDSLVFFFSTLLLGNTCSRAEGTDLLITGSLDCRPFWSISSVHVEGDHLVDLLEKKNMSICSRRQYGYD